MHLIGCIVHKMPNGESAGRNVISIASWKARQFNAHLVECFSCQLELDFTALTSYWAIEAWTVRSIGNRIDQENF